ncbi:MAG: HAD-IA family hydrolase, partial [Ilumatobacteraceae bacterium]
LDAYVATMNMGTLVGAPKLKAAELLRRLEPTRRGPYGGAAGYLTACLTNNVRRPASSGAREQLVESVMARFDIVVESSEIGVRKPEPRFYEIACERLGVAPDDCVFLDDLGINLKPAAAMGMHTIKVLDAPQAIADVEHALGWRPAASPR